MSKQTNFFDYHNLKETKRRYGRTIHGGANTTGHRKLERPLSSKKPVHLVLKSEKAKGQYSFLTAKNKILVEKVIREKAQKFFVTIHDFVNVGNHLHIKVSLKSRGEFQKFLKAITALIARYVTGAKKGKRFGKFWQGLAFTRVLTSHLEELNLKGYFIGNRIEAGEVKLRSEEFLCKFRKWVYQERVKCKHLRYCEIQNVIK